MNYAAFSAQFDAHFGDLQQRWPLSTFVLDHYLRAVLLKRWGVVTQHCSYLRQVMRYARPVDLASRGLSFRLKKDRESPTLLVSAALAFSFPWLLRDLSEHPACRDYNLGFFGLCSYNPFLIRSGYRYLSLYRPLFSRSWSAGLYRGLRSFEAKRDLSGWEGWAVLELQTAALVEQLTQRLIIEQVEQVIGLRDFFWYEAALILACRKAAIPYHVVAHGYPHCDPAKGDATGFLPFRGDYLYCMSEESYRQFAPWVATDRCRSVRLFSPDREKKGEGLLLISTVGEESGTFSPAYRQRVYQGLKSAAERTGRKVVIRFRDDEELPGKISQLKPFGFSWTVKNRLSLEADLDTAGFVFGFSSTALYLSRSLGLPTYNIGGYGRIEGVADLAPENIADVVTAETSFEPDIDTRPSFAEVLFATAAGSYLPAGEAQPETVI